MVDAHNATVLNPQALGPGSELQRSLTDILVQLNSFDSKMNDQLNDKWTQLTAQLHDVACIGCAITLLLALALHTASSHVTFPMMHLSATGSSASIAQVKV